MGMITTIGLDIAKSVFQVHGIDADGDVMVRRKLARSRVLTFFEKLPGCLVGIVETAGSGKPIWADAHQVRAFGRDLIRAKGIMASGDVKPHRRPNTWPHQPAERSSLKNHLPTGSRSLIASPLSIFFRLIAAPGHGSLRGRNSPPQHLVRSTSAARSTAS